MPAGIAANRADAVRWALARIRERPAYSQLRERAREIERLKTEFQECPGRQHLRSPVNQSEPPPSPARRRICDGGYATGSERGLAPAKPATAGARTRRTVTFEPRAAVAAWAVH